MFFLSYLLIFILDERRQKYSRSKSLASFSEFLFYCHILSYLFLKNHSEFFTCLRYFMKHAGFTFWTNKYCRFTITKICCSAWTIIQTFFCSIANYFKLFRIGIVIISVSAELRIVSEKKNNMVIDIHSKYQFLTKLRSFKVVPKILLSPNLNIDTYYWGVY